MTLREANSNECNDYDTIINHYISKNICDIRKVKLKENYLRPKLSYTMLFENKL